MFHILASKSYAPVLNFADELHFLQAANKHYAEAAGKAHASTSSGPSSNGNAVHGDEQGTSNDFSRLQSIIIDPATGEARNAATGETMEMPLQSPRVAPSTPPPVPITEFQHLASDADVKVSDPHRCSVECMVVGSYGFSSNISLKVMDGIAFFPLFSTHENIRRWEGVLCALMNRASACDIQDWCSKKSLVCYTVYHLSILSMI